MKRRLGISAYYKVRMIVWEKCGKDFGFDLIYYKKPKWIWTESGHYQGINVKGAEKEIFLKLSSFWIQMKTQMYMSQLLWIFLLLIFLVQLAKRQEFQNNFSKSLLYHIYITLGITIGILILMVVIARVCLDILFLKIIQNITTSNKFGFW